MPEGIEKLIPGGAKAKLALSIAFTHHGSEIVFDDVDGGKIDSRGGLGRLRNDEIDGSVGSDGARPLQIEVGFHFISLNAGIRPVEDDLWIIARQSEQAAKISHILEVDVGLAHNGNGLPSTVDSRGPQRQNVVDGSEVVRSQSVIARIIRLVAFSTTRGKREQWLDWLQFACRSFAGELPKDLTHRLSGEVM